MQKPDANIENARIPGAESAHDRAIRHRDRRLAYEAYQEKKRRLGERLRERHRQIEQVLEQAGAGQAQPQGDIERADDEARSPEPASSASAIDDGGQAAPSSRKKLFSEVPSIEAERIVLDRVVDADAEALLDLIENPLVQRYEPTYLYEKQRDDIHETIRLMYGDLFQDKESLILAIRAKGTGELLGLAEFYGLRDHLHKISIGYRLRECWWGKGYATEAARLMVSYLYDETDIEVITASTMVENEASAHVLEKVDFIRTARGVEEDWGYPEPTIVDKWFC